MIWLNGSSNKKVAFNEIFSLNSYDYVIFQSVWLLGVSKEKILQSSIDSNHDWSVSNGVQLSSGHQ